MLINCKNILKKASIAHPLTQQKLLLCVISNLLKPLQNGQKNTDQIVIDIPNKL